MRGAFVASDLIHVRRRRSPLLFSFSSRSSASLKADSKALGETKRGGVGERRGWGGERRKAFKSLKLNETHGRGWRRRCEEVGEAGGERRKARGVPPGPAVWKPAAAGNKLLGCSPAFDAEAKLSVNRSCRTQRCVE